MDNHKKHVKFYNRVLRLLGGTIRRRFGYECDDLRKIEGPYLVLSNHNTDIDPGFVGLAFGQHMYFVASEHIMHKGKLSEFIKENVDPIVHLKSGSGIRTTKEMLKRLGAGYNVCMFPEGNRSFNGLTYDIPEVVGRLAVKCKCKVITFRLTGGYFTEPRWGTGFRQGRMEGRLVHIYEPEELREMTAEEAYQAICNDLYEDAYATQEQKPVKYKGKSLARGLETTLFRCPTCGRYQTLRSDDNYLHCDACDFRVKYDELCWLTDAEGNKHSVTEYDLAQRQALESFDGSFEDRVEVVHFDKDHKVTKRYNGTLRVSKTEGSILPDANKNQEAVAIDIDYAQLHGMAIYSNNKLTISYGQDEEHIEIYGNESFNALKYLYLYKLSVKK